jgi:hypothetical protein
MNHMDKRWMYQTLCTIGFVQSADHANLFFIDAERELTPAYSCMISRKNHRVRWGGGVGLYFREFERDWRKSLSAVQRRADVTLPMTMLLDNYVRLLGDEFFSYEGDQNEICVRARLLYRLCALFPKSIHEFMLALESKEIVGKRISDYMHIFDYHVGDSLYLRKSVAFVHWFTEKWPSSTDKIYACLTDAQRRRLNVEELR